MWAWGANWSGQLGDGTSTPSNVPLLLTGPTGVVALAAGGEHSLAVQSDGTVLAWGANFSGQLGDGTTDERTSPVAVAGLTDVVALAAGYAHTLALKSDDGTVLAWGENFSGQLGDGTTNGRLTPVPVAGLTDVVAVAAGDSHSLALKSDGSAWAWGANYSGQLGDGTTNDQTLAVPVATLTDVVAIAAGESHSLALRSDGSGWAWGANYSGQLGRRHDRRAARPRVCRGPFDAHRHCRRRRAQPRPRVGRIGLGLGSELLGPARERDHR